MMPDDANTLGSIASGAVKGVSLESSSTILDKVEKTITQSIAKTMQDNNFIHLPNDFEVQLYKKAFSLNSIYAYQASDNPIKLLEDSIKTAFTQSKTYDIETLDVESLSTILIENIDHAFQCDHELTTLSTFYANKEILSLLKNLISNTSEFEKAILNIKPLSEHRQPNQLHFLNSQIGFYGRATEFEQLDSFCADELCKLYEKHGDIEPKISYYYAMALNNVVCKITYSKNISLYEDAEFALSKLSELYNKHVVTPNNYDNTIVCVVNAVSDAELKKQVTHQIKELTNILQC